MCGNFHKIQNTYLSTIFIFNIPHLLGFWISMKDIVSMLDCRCRVSSCTLDTGESQPDIKICRDFEFLYFSIFLLFYSFPTFYFLSVPACSADRMGDRRSTSSPSCRGVWPCRPPGRCPLSPSWSPPPACSEDTAGDRLWHRQYKSQINLSHWH